MLPTASARRLVRVALAPVFGLSLLTACEGETDPTGVGGLTREPALN
ncbi:MAG: hypothetical protein HEQ38_19665 [Gemmatimonas sp.]|nr:hypothetical protein [Gemmatimonas sp.]